MPRKAKISMEIHARQLMDTRGGTRPNSGKKPGTLTRYKQEEMEEIQLGAGDSATKKPWAVKWAAGILREANEEEVWKSFLVPPANRDSVIDSILEASGLQFKEEEVPILQVILREVYHAGWLAGNDKPGLRLQALKYLADKRDGKSPTADYPTYRGKRMDNDSIMKGAIGALLPKPGESVTITHAAATAPTPQPQTMTVGVSPNLSPSDPPEELEP